MKARRYTIQAVAVLIVLGAACMGARVAFQQKKRVMPGDTFWQLSYSLEVNAKKIGSKVRAAFPGDTNFGRVYHFEFSGGAHQLDRSSGANHGMREFGFTADQTGPQTVKAQFQIHLNPRAAWRTGSSAARISAEERAGYLRSEKSVQIEDQAVLDTFERIQEDSSGAFELLDRIFEFCVAEIRAGGREAPTDAATVLKQHVASASGRARAFVALCRVAKMPARLVTGFEIKQGVDVRPHIWAEVLVNDRWEPYDPENGFSRDLPHNYMPVRRDGAAIVRSVDVSDLKSTFTIVRTAPPGDFRSEVSTPSDLLDLTRLPLEMQQSFVVILLLPLGALVTAFFRTIVGLRTFGTFTPSLLALSFVHEDWRTGLVVFVVILVLGLMSRSLLEHLKLLLVPRLSAILTLVVLCLVMAVSTMDYFELTPSSNAVLLPMVILTMTIERFFLTSEEDSSVFASQLLAGTLFMAACCYLVLCWGKVGRFFLAFPEAHLFTIAILVVLGRYAGYRLSELWRFRDLAQPKS